jgi:hypothetical protein
MEVQVVFEDRRFTTGRKPGPTPAAGADTTYAG